MPTTDTHLDAFRWDNAGSSRLLLIFPGASGIGATPGYKSLASWFWLHSYNVLLCLPPGSDGMEGEYDMMAWLENSIREMCAFRDGKEIREIQAIGACAGGAVAAHLLRSDSCGHIGKALALFETPLRWSPPHLSEFRIHAVETGIRPSERCYADVLHLADALDDNGLGCLFGHGDDLRIPFTSDDLADVKRVVPNHRIVSIERANHGLLKRGPSRSLLKFCEAADHHFQTHAN
jgi:hypothetical protein